MVAAAKAAAGCPLIQVEEPPHHMRAQQPDCTDADLAFLTEAFNRQLTGVNAEIWVHTCWGNPNQQRVHWKVPSYERALPPEINMHSVKNRFLMRVKNISPDLYWRNWFSITMRDLTVVACCLLWEHTSIKAFWYLARNWKRVMAKRREIMRRKRVNDDYIASWFRYVPVSAPASKPKSSARALARSKAARG